MHSAHQSPPTNGGHEVHPTLACFCNLTQHKDLKRQMRNAFASLPHKTCRQ